MGIRPEDILVTDDADMRGEVFIVEPLGRDDMLDVRLADGTRLIALADTRLKIRAGDNVGLKLKSEKTQLFDRQSEQSLIWNRATQ